MPFSFSDLDLTGTQPERGSTTLTPGKYVAKITSAEMKQDKRGGSQVVVKLSDIHGAGSITDHITVFVPKTGRADVDEKSNTSMTIGRQRLMALLTFGGHPNPAKPGDIRSMNGMVVGIWVEEGDEFVNSDGKTVRAAGKLRKYGAYMDPVELGYAGPRGGSASAGGSAAFHDDKIPF